MGVKVVVGVAALAGACEASAFHITNMVGGCGCVGICCVVCAVCTNGDLNG